MPGPTTDFSSGPQTPGQDGRLDTPAFHRNHAAIAEVLQRRLGGLSGDVLEIGSGSGQHALVLARALPQLDWWPSDPSEVHRNSIAAWRDAEGARNLHAPLVLDAASPDWGIGEGHAGPAGDVAAILAFNVIHIAPWRVAEGILAGAGRHLRPGGLLVFYGPFRRGGTHTAESNAAFDASLRARDPDWGVRDLDDVSDLAERAGLRPDEVVEMPANNLIVVFARDA